MSNNLFATESYFVDNGRNAVWEEQGTMVKEAKTSEDVVKLAELDYLVEKEEALRYGKPTGSYWNVRRMNTGDPSEDIVLGTVGKQYTNLQNRDAFKFMDEMQGGRVLYESAGFFGKGEVVWIQARLAEDYTILGDKVIPYIVLKNSFNGSSGVKVAMTPYRVTCKNTLNLAFKDARKAKRVWSARHSGSIETRIWEARHTLGMAEAYMKLMGDKFEELHKIKLRDEDKVKEIVQMIVPINDSITDRKKRNLIETQNDILYRYFNMPDLVVMDNTAARLIHAVSDTASHKDPARRTKKYAENKFANFIEGKDTMIEIAPNTRVNLVDRAYDVVTGIR